MLHKINLSTTSEPILQCVLDFMERLLEFFCLQDPKIKITTQDLEARFGVDVTNWLNNNKSNVLDNLKNFSKRPQPDKLNTLAQFRNDRSFTAHLADPVFHFRLHQLSNNDDLKIWLVRFYEQLRSIDGFHPIICNHHSHFHYQDWWESFDTANPHQTMCCTCDGTMNHGKTIEHYFPKALYPALSIHPLNLIPVCNKCNNDKGNTDPLEGVNFDQIFIPYRDDIDKVVDLEFTVIPGGKEQIQLCPVGVDPNLTTKIRKYSELFAIPAQWNSNIHEISPIATRFLKQLVRGMKKTGNVISKDSLKLIIDDVCDDMEKDWGDAHYFYPASKWLRWAKDNKFESLCKELEIM